MIIGEIRRYLRDNNSVRVSRSLRDIAYKALQARATIANEQMRDATIEEIAKMIDTPLEDVVFAMEAIQDPVSIFEPIYSDGGDAIYVMDHISDEKVSEESWLNHLAVNEGVKKLNDREKQIIKLRFFNGKTQMEVASEIGISQAQVSRLEKSALKHLKKHV